MNLSTVHLFDRNSPTRFSRHTDAKVLLSSAFAITRLITLKLFGGGQPRETRAEGVLLPQNVHIATCDLGCVSVALDFLKNSPKTKKYRAKFLLSTDGEQIEAENLTTGDVISCEWQELVDNFSFFLPLAGITTVQAIVENPIDIKATARLNRLYLELQRTNPDWATNTSDFNINRFMAQLIFCFFAEDTGIFHKEDVFTDTVENVGKSDDSHDIISTLFQAMATPIESRIGQLASSWAKRFPYVNGGLFSKPVQVPYFSPPARSYLIHAGKLDWKSINPDIFGSMIQAVADPEERGQLGMHYTSIPNILKVLNPLFLDELRKQLTDSWDSPQKLLNLLKRIGRIRVFDPACGSGNFLVVAYKQLRDIEHQIVERRIKLSRKSNLSRTHNRSVISINNFYGIEIKEFACEVARLSLLIAEYQCDVSYLGQQLASEIVLPLNDNQHIFHGNALLMDWTSLCQEPSEDYIQTYICGNPPYKGSQTQTKSQKDNLKQAFCNHKISTRQLDYVAGWFVKAAEYAQTVKSDFAFVSTNSICQGRIVPIFWPVLISLGMKIEFAHTSFKWSNLATRNAGVVVIVVALTRKNRNPRLYSTDHNEKSIVRKVHSINPYLIAAPTTIVKGRSNSISNLSTMFFGNMPLDGGNLLMDMEEYNDLEIDKKTRVEITRKIYGSSEFIRGLQRFCLWIENRNLNSAVAHPEIQKRIEAVRMFRRASVAPSTIEYSKVPHQFTSMHHGKLHTIVIPGVSSENRPYLPVGVVDQRTVVSNLAFGMYDAPIFNLSLIASRLHLIWIATVCGRLGTGYRYSNTIGWNTFPVPKLTDKNKLDLSTSAREILYAREKYFPATIAEIYDPERLDKDFPLVRKAHEANCETLERIYTKTFFKNDTERLEKLFELYDELIRKEKAKEIENGN